MLISPHNDERSCPWLPDDIHDPNTVRLCVECAPGAFIQMLRKIEVSHAVDQSILRLLDHIQTPNKRLKNRNYDSHLKTIQSFRF